jgi:hypothetical protein
VKRGTKTTPASHREGENVIPKGRVSAISAVGRGQAADDNPFHQRASRGWAPGSRR